MVMSSSGSTAGRVEKHDAALIARGGRKLNGIRLQPEAAASLAQMEQAGESATGAINRLLVAAAHAAGYS